MSVEDEQRAVHVTELRRRFRELKEIEKEVSGLINKEIDRLNRYIAAYNSYLRISVLATLKDELTDTAEMIVNLDDHPPNAIQWMEQLEALIQSIETSEITELSRFHPEYWITTLRDETDIVADEIVELGSSPV